MLFACRYSVALYRIDISVAIGRDGNVVYNIGDIVERSLPTINGSSENNGALNGETSSKEGLPYAREKVKKEKPFF